MNDNEMRRDYPVGARVRIPSGACDWGLKEATHRIIGYTDGGRLRLQSIVDPADKTTRLPRKVRVTDPERTTETPNAIVGYEFLLDHGRRRVEWTQLHGSGGALGNGALHVQDPAKIGPVCLSLLRKARAELEREGTVRRSNDARHGEPLTIERVSPVAVLDCRPIYLSPMRAV